MRGIVAVDQTEPTTIALMWDDEAAWIRFHRDADDIRLSKDEVKELFNSFRSCIDQWERKKSK